MDKLYDALAVGIAAVDDLLYVAEYPLANCKVPVIDKERHGGGPACTAIAAIGMLHGRAAYVARLGENELSSYIQSALKRRNVDVSHIVYDSTGGPYHSIIVVDGSGHRNVFYDPSLYRSVLAEDLQDSLIQSAALVLLDHLDEPSLTPVAEKARRLGVPILGDIEGRSVSAVILAEMMDYLVVPKEFALWASGERHPREACSFLARVKRTATVVTDGVDGCYFQSNADNGIKHVPAFKVDAYDTNGCGDTFHGAMALAVARNLALNDAVMFASAAAALKAMAAYGKSRGWNALPTLDEVFLFLRSRLGEPERSLILEKLQQLKPPRASVAHSLQSEGQEPLQ